jgi:seryl-tRNA synthetase
MACTVPLCAQSTTQPASNAYLGNQHPRVMAVRAELDHAQQRYDDQMQKVGALTEWIRHATGRIEVSAESLHQAAGKLDDQLMDLELEDAASRARMDAILHELDKLEHATTRMSDHDSATAELEKVVAVKQTEYDRMIQLRATAAISQSEVEEGAAQLAEAKARVAVQREQSVVAAGGDTILALRKQLTDLTIAQQDRSARLQYLAPQREKLEKGLSVVDELQHAKAGANSLEQRINELELQLRSIDN